MDTVTVENGCEITRTMDDAGRVVAVRVVDTARRDALERVRLTADDYRAMTVAVLAGIPPQPRNVQRDAVRMVVLERVAVRAIGCTFADLRTRELELVAQLVAGCIDRTPRVLVRGGPVVERCWCPSDCNCRHQGAPFHRVNYCGCTRHP